MKKHQQIANNENTNQKNAQTKNNMSTKSRRLVRRGGHEQRAWRRQSSAEWAACAVTDLCDKNQAWTTCWLRLRAHCDDDFRDATEAAALDAHDEDAFDELFAKHITAELADECLPVWAMAEVSDEDGTPTYADAHEPELIDMPPTAAHLRCPTWSRALHCVCHTALDRVDAPTNCHLHNLSASLSVVSRVGCLVCCAHACVSTS